MNSAPAEAARFEVTEFSANGVVFESNGVTVTAFEVNHGEIIKPAYGYRIDYAGRSVVISGDTRFDENVIAAAEGADLIIHEVAAFHESLVDANPAMQNILDHHTTPSKRVSCSTESNPSSPCTAISSGHRYQAFPSFRSRSYYDKRTRATTARWSRAKT